MTASDIQQLEAIWNLRVTWNGTEYPCFYGARQESRDLGFGGYATQASLEVVLRKELFVGSYPEPEQGLTVGGRLLSIESVTHSHDGKLLVLACKDPTKGV